MKTLTEITKEHGITATRVRYAIDKLGLKPDEVVGNTRRFRQEKEKMILAYLRIDHRKKK